MDLVAVLDKPHHDRSGERRAEGGGGRSAEGHPGLHRRSGGLHRHAAQSQQQHRGFRYDQGAGRQPGEGSGLVRQRVGLLLPRRRPGRRSWSQKACKFRAGAGFAARPGVFSKSPPSSPPHQPVHPRPFPELLFGCGPMRRARRYTGTWPEQLLHTASTPAWRWCRTGCPA